MTKELVVIVIYCTDSGFYAFIYVGALEHYTSYGISCMFVMHSVIPYY